MTSVITFLTLAVLTHTLVKRIVKGPDRKWVSMVVLAAWLCFFPLIEMVNHWFPFTGAGDDEDYFRLAATPFDSLADVFDLTKFIGLMEQPGYPWLLSIVYQLTGQDLLAFKLLNLACFVLLIPVWYRIGVEVDSRRFGRAMALAILLLTPLWFYWMFLLKDMIIVLLQSIFLLGAVQVSRTPGKAGWLLVLTATLALIPFRSPLVLLNMAVLAGTVALMLVRRRQPGRSFATLSIAAIVIWGVLNIASNPEWMAFAGIYSEHRVIKLESVTESAMSRGEVSTMDRSLFPLLYLFSETSGLNPRASADFNPGNLRGVLAVPWIFVGVPFFMCGLLWLMRSDPRLIHRGGAPKPKSSRLIATPWGTLALFILGYMIVSWAVGDTTRWRIPDLPAMAAVALAGWLSLAPQTRLTILICWIAASGTSLSLFYMARAS